MSEAYSPWKARRLPQPQFSAPAHLPFHRITMRADACAAAELPGEVTIYSRKNRSSILRSEVTTAEAILCLLADLVADGPVVLTRLEIGERPKATPCGLAEIPSVKCSRESAR